LFSGRACGDICVYDSHGFDGVGGIMDKDKNPAIKIIWLNAIITILLPILLLCFFFVFGAEKPKKERQENLSGINKIIKAHPFVADCKCQPLKDQDDILKIYAFVRLNGDIRENANDSFKIDIVDYYNDQKPPSYPDITWMEFVRP
jgi:hypothetical protein